MQKDLQKRKKSTSTQNKFTIGCWNIRRGLVRREKELEEILRREAVDVMFLVETDTSSINEEEKDYAIAGYRTILPKLDETDNKVGILGLIKEEHSSKIKVRSDLMSEDFPSIWLEAERKNRRSLVIGGSTENGPDKEIPEKNPK